MRRTHDLIAPPRRPFQRALSLVAAASLAFGVVGACGDDDDGGDESPPSTAPQGSGGDSVGGGSGGEGSTGDGTGDTQVDPDSNASDPAGSNSDEGPANGGGTGSGGSTGGADGDTTDGAGQEAPVND